MFAALAGIGTVGAADAAGTDLVFISHEKSGTVAVLDPSQDHAVVKQIATCQRPRDMNLEASHELYVACGATSLPMRWSSCDTWPMATSTAWRLSSHWARVSSRSS